MSGLFETMYGASPATQLENKKPLIINKLNRQYAAMIDSAEGQKIDALEKINTLRTNFDKMDINAILAQKEIIISADATIAAIKDEQKIMFGE